MNSLLAVLVFAALAWAVDDKELLANYDPTVREAAANRLAGAGAKNAVPELIECLVDEALQVRVAALRALGMAGSDAKLALPEIRRLFRDTAPEVRTEAYVAAARVGDIAGLGAAVRLDKGVLDALDKNHDDVLRALLGHKSWRGDEVTSPPNRHKRLSSNKLRRRFAARVPQGHPAPGTLTPLGKGSALGPRALGRVVLRLSVACEDPDNSACS